LKVAANDARSIGIGSDPNSVRFFEPQCHEGLIV
jgi:hypothetical protein